jgi:hypothetical protein
MFNSAEIKGIVKRHDPAATSGKTTAKSRRRFRRIVFISRYGFSDVSFYCCARPPYSFCKDEMILAGSLAG